MLLTRKQLCEHLAIGDYSLRQLIKAGKIPFIRINEKLVRYDPVKVEAALTKEFEKKTGGNPQTQKTVFKKRQ